MQINPPMRSRFIQLRRVNSDKLHISLTYSKMYRLTHIWGLDACTLFVAQFSFIISIYREIR